MDAQLTSTFKTIEDLFFRLEYDNNLDRAEAMLKSLAENVTDPAVLARVYGEMAQATYWRYEYAPKSELLVIAAKGAKLAERGLEYDPNNLQANAWAAAMKGYYGLQMGILSSLHYMPIIKAHAERVVKLDEKYRAAMGHQTLGELHRLSPPPHWHTGTNKKRWNIYCAPRNWLPKTPKPNGAWLSYTSACAKKI